MNYKTIPFGIRKSIIKKTYNEVVKQVVANFKIQNPQQFQVGTKVVLPTTKKTLLGGWQGFDPKFLNTVLTSPLPKTVTIKEAYVSTDYHNERVFYYNASKLEEIQTVERLTWFIQDMAKDALYWTYTLNGVPFTWGVPQAFLISNSK